MFDLFANEHSQTLALMASVFGCLTGVITLLFGFFVWLFKKMVGSLEVLHNTTLPTLSLGIQEELKKQTVALESIKKNQDKTAPVCQYPLQMAKS